MATGKPFPSKDFTIEVADTNVTPAWKKVGGVTSWDSDGNEELTETDVFMEADPISNVGRTHVSFMIQGLLYDITDEGLIILSAHNIARDVFMLRCKWNGTDGFTCSVRVASRKKTGRAGNGFAEVQWNLQVVPSSITIVGLGPVL